MKSLTIVFLLLSSFFSYAQVPMYRYSNINYSQYLPEGLRNNRSAVIILPKTTSLPSGASESEDWMKLVNETHPLLVKMGIDPVLYINHRNMVASNQALSGYATRLQNRRVKNLIFITHDKGKFELVVAPFSKEDIIAKNISSFKIKADTFDKLMYDFSWSLKRAEQRFSNFLIPEYPQLDKGITIIEKERVKRYPGQLRRSKLAVEKFTKLSTEKIADKKLKERIMSYNNKVEENNKQLDSILKQVYPFEYILIEPMNQDQLMRNRLQFVLRNSQTTISALRSQLGYEKVLDGKKAKSVIPLMPDRRYYKSMSGQTIAYKFYLRQNISKNIHVGEWDADIKWQDALQNYINNAIQQFNKSKRMKKK